MNISNLKFPPIKPIKYTNFFIYKGLAAQKAEYIAFSNKGERLAKMIAYPEILIEDLNYFGSGNSNLQSFYIEALYVNKRGKKIGSKMLNIAEKESFLYDCLGKLHLVSSDCYFPNRPPHIFYRKNGFKAKDEKINKLIDKYIKHHKNFSFGKFDNIFMSRSPKEKNEIMDSVRKNSEHKSFISGIQNNIKNILKSLFNNNVN